jgi:hypothetical protein
MGEKSFHYPDDTVFHGTDTAQGYTFREARTLIDDDEKILKLKTRLTGYYVNGLLSIPHSFMMAIMTCVGIEVLGQVVLGYKNTGETEKSNTISIYKMLDQVLTNALSDNFKINYDKNRGQICAHSFSTYADVLCTGFRNAFTHTYRSLGVFLGGNTLITINEDEGLIIVNHELFRKRFIECYEDCFDKIISNSPPIYRQNAFKIF